MSNTPDRGNDAAGAAAAADALAVTPVAAPAASRRRSSSASAAAATAKPCGRPGRAERPAQRPSAVDTAAAQTPGSTSRGLRDRQTAATPKKPWWEV